MPIKKNNLGFIERETNLDLYKERFVYAAHNSETVWGVVQDINVNQGYVDFKPSIVGNGDGSLSINTELPTRFSLPISFIRPISGTLEDYIKAHNQKLKNKDKKTSGEENDTNMP